MTLRTEVEVTLAGPRMATGFDYSQIDEAYRDEVQTAARSIHQMGAAFRGSVIAIGKRLIAVKGMLPHGQFGDWLIAEFGMSDRTARNFMNVAREYEFKTEILPFLSDTVLYMLAAPSTPEAARVEVEQAAANGERVTVGRVKEVVDRHKPADEVERAAVTFAKPDIKAQRKEIKPLHEAHERTTPTLAKPTYLQPEAEESPSPLTPEEEDDPDGYGAFGMFDRSWVMGELTKGRPDAPDFKTALDLAKVYDLRVALRFNRIFGRDKYQGARLDAISERLVAGEPTVEELAAMAEVEQERAEEEAERWAMEGPLFTAPPAPTEPHLARAVALRDTLLSARELAGRDTALLEWGDGIGNLLEPLNHYIAKLNGGGR